MRLKVEDQLKRKPSKFMAHKCGNCTLCCTLILVNDIPKTGLAHIEKPGYTRCVYEGYVSNLRHNACTIYADRPASCAAWKCHWLMSPTLADELRPDRCGIVFNPSEFLDPSKDGRRIMQAYMTRGHEDDYATVEAVAMLLRRILDEGAEEIFWHTEHTSRRISMKGNELYVSHAVTMTGRKEPLMPGEQRTVIDPTIIAMTENFAARFGDAAQSVAQSRASHCWEAFARHKRGTDQFLFKSYCPQNANGECVTVGIVYDYEVGNFRCGLADEMQAELRQHEGELPRE